MTTEQKAQKYGELMNEHTRCFNQINSIKGESLELNEEQKSKVRKLEQRQQQIMQEVNRLLS